MEISEIKRKIIDKIREENITITDKSHLKSAPKNTANEIRQA